MPAPTEKPTGTSAVFTAFCGHKLEGPRGSYLWIDGNGKITAGNGTLNDPKPNAFSLVEIDDCPFATETCKAACYVHGLKKFAPETHALYKHNSQEIRRILSNNLDTDIWVGIMSRWITENCPGGFRWHVSGDIYSPEYADFIRMVVLNSPKVRHWIYTRSFPFVDKLLPVSTNNGGNLTINLSCDKSNYGAGVRKLAEDHGLRLCYLTDDGQVPADLRDGDVIFPDYALRGGTERGQEWFAGLVPQYKSFVCPVDYHGKSEVRRCGPCNRCLK